MLTVLRDEKEDNLIVRNDPDEQAKKRKDKEEVTEDDEDLEEKKRKLESRTFNIAVKFCDYWCTPLTKTMKITLMPSDLEFKK